MLNCNYFNSDCVKFSDEYDGELFDAVVTDPPYGIEYLGNSWDSYKNCVAFKEETWRSISKTLKPGGYLLIFGASKTFHRLTCAVEDSGLKIKDVLMWLYGQGMPKSQNMGKKNSDWEGWGTGLKPCYEPILLAQKPIEEKTILKNLEKHGVGAINIEESRLDSGRWPGNVIHDGSDEVEEQFAKFGERGNGWSRNYGVEDYQGRQYGGGVFGGGGYIGETTYCDEGTASRFFYSTKSSVKERTHNRTVENNHPTVKNLELMKYLIKLITPTGGTVYDPFAGSGTTLIAAKDIGFNSVGVEMSEEYCEIIKNRVSQVTSPLEQIL
jgi:site-specific DNA-methyltransferase (adenine-specific)|tara:strand:+ start:369 stop:1343 length:975 start_codon:yes stop_codon:yes gene_type:complete